MSRSSLHAARCLRQETASLQAGAWGRRASLQEEWTYAHRLYTGA